MPTMSMLMLKGKIYKEQIKLKNKYLNKSIYINKEHLAISTSCGLNLISLLPL